MKKKVKDQIFSDLSVTLNFQYNIGCCETHSNQLKNTKHHLEWGSERGEIQPFQNLC